MSTRSTYRVIETGVWEGKPWKKSLMLMYIQCDGYPSGHAMETAEWLSKAIVVNGIGKDSKGKLAFNGAGCLAAQLVAKYKNGIGGTYLHSVKERGHCGEDYVYDIIVNSETKEITFAAYDVDGGWGNKPLRFKKLYSGNPAGYAKWVEERK